jgi:hypothetical protein
MDLIKQPLQQNDLLMFLYCLEVVCIVHLWNRIFNRCWTFSIRMNGGFSPFLIFIIWYIWVDWSGCFIRSIIIEWILWTNTRFFLIRWIWFPGWKIFTFILR